MATVPFTAFDPVTRLVLYSGTTADPSLLPHTAFEGFAADSRYFRVKLDMSGVEPKTPLVASLDRQSILSGESVTVTVGEPSVCWIDDVQSGLIEDDGEIEFGDAGTYDVRLEPVSGLAIPARFTVIVS